MRTDNTLRITRRQYRQFAELAKLNGVGLTLDTFSNLGGIWGEYSCWAQPMVLYRGAVRAGGYRPIR